MQDIIINIGHCYSVIICFVFRTNTRHQAVTNGSAVKAKQRIE